MYFNLWSMRLGKDVLCCKLMDPLSWLEEVVELWPWTIGEVGDHVVGIVLGIGCLTRSIIILININ